MHNAVRPNEDLAAGRFGGLASICANGICESASSTVVSSAVA